MSKPSELNSHHHETSSICVEISGNTIKCWNPKVSAVNVKAPDGVYQTCTSKIFFIVIITIIVIAIFIMGNLANAQKKTFSLWEDF